MTRPGQAGYYRPEHGELFNLFRYMRAKQTASTRPTTANTAKTIQTVALLLVPSELAMEISPMLRNDPIAAAMLIVAKLRA